MRLKVKVSPIQATKAFRAGRGVALSQFKISALKLGVRGQHHTPAALPPRNIRYQLYRRLGGSRAGLVLCVEGEQIEILVNKALIMRIKYNI